MEQSEMLDLLINFDGDHPIYVGQEPQSDIGTDALLNNFQDLIDLGTDDFEQCLQEAAKLTDKCCDGDTDDHVFLAPRPVTGFSSPEQNGSPENLFLPKTLSAKSNGNLTDQRAYRQKWKDWRGHEGANSDDDEEIIVGHGMNGEEDSPPPPKDLTGKGWSTVDSGISSLRDADNTDCESLGTCAYRDSDVDFDCSTVGTPTPNHVSDYEPIDSKLLSRVEITPCQDCKKESPGNSSMVGRSGRCCDASPAGGEQTCSIPQRKSNHDRNVVGQHSRSLVAPGLLLRDKEEQTEQDCSDSENLNSPTTPGTELGAISEEDEITPNDSEEDEEEQEEELEEEVEQDNDEEEEEEEDEEEEEEVDQATSDIDISPNQPTSDAGDYEEEEEDEEEEVDQATSEIDISPNQPTSEAGDYVSSRSSPVTCSEAGETEYEEEEDDEEEDEEDEENEDEEDESEEEEEIEYEDTEASEYNDEEEETEDEDDESSQLAEESSASRIGESDEEDIEEEDCNNQSDSMGSDTIEYGHEQSDYDLDTEMDKSEDENNTNDSNCFSSTVEIANYFSPNFYSTNGYYGYSPLKEEPLPCLNDPMPDCHNHNEKSVHLTNNILSDEMRNCKSEVNCGHVLECTALPHRQKRKSGVTSAVVNTAKCDANSSLTAQNNPSIVVKSQSSWQRTFQEEFLKHAYLTQLEDVTDTSESEEIETEIKQCMSPNDVEYNIGFVPVVGERENSEGHRVKISEGKLDRIPCEQNCSTKSIEHTDVLLQLSRTEEDSFCIDKPNNEDQVSTDQHQKQMATELHNRRFKKRPLKWQDRQQVHPIVVQAEEKGDRSEVDHNDALEWFDDLGRTSVLLSKKQSSKDTTHSSQEQDDQSNSESHETLISSENVGLDKQMSIDVHEEDPALSVDGNRVEDRTMDWFDDLGTSSMSVAEHPSEQNPGGVYEARTFSEPREDDCDSQEEDFENEMNEGVSDVELVLETNYEDDSDSQARQSYFNKAIPLMEPEETDTDDTEQYAEMNEEENCESKNVHPSKESGQTEILSECVSTEHNKETSSQFSQKNIIETEIVANSHEGVNQNEIEHSEDVMSPSCCERIEKEPENNNTLQCKPLPSFEFEPSEGLDDKSPSKKTDDPPKVENTSSVPHSPTKSNSLHDEEEAPSNRHPELCFSEGSVSPGKRLKASESVQCIRVKYTDDPVRRTETELFFRNQLCQLNKTAVSSHDTAFTGGSSEEPSKVDNDSEHGKDSETQVDDHDTTNIPDTVRDERTMEENTSCNTDLTGTCLPELEVTKKKSGRPKKQKGTSQKAKETVDQNEQTGSVAVTKSANVSGSSDFTCTVLSREQEGQSRDGGSASPKYSSCDLSASVESEHGSCSSARSEEPVTSAQSGILDEGDEPDSKEKCIDKHKPPDELDVDLSLEPSTTEECDNHEADSENHNIEHLSKIDEKQDPNECPNTEEDMPILDSFDGMNEPNAEGSNAPLDKSFEENTHRDNPQIQTASSLDDSPCETIQGAGDDALCNKSDLTTHLSEHQEESVQSDIEPEVLGDSEPEVQGDIEAEVPCIINFTNPKSKRRGRRRRKRVVKKKVSKSNSGNLDRTSQDATVSSCDPQIEDTSQDCQGHSLATDASLRDRDDSQDGQSQSVVATATLHDKDYSQTNQSQSVIMGASTNDQDCSQDSQSQSVATDVVLQEADQPLCPPSPVQDDIGDVVEAKADQQTEFVESDLKCSDDNEEDKKSTSNLYLGLLSASDLPEQEIYYENFDVDEDELSQAAKTESEGEESRPVQSKTVATNRRKRGKKRQYYKKKTSSKQSTGLSEDDINMQTELPKIRPQGSPRRSNKRMRMQVEQSVEEEAREEDVDNHQHTPTRSSLRPRSKVSYREEDLVASYCDSDRNENGSKIRTNLEAKKIQNSEPQEHNQSKRSLTTKQTKTTRASRRLQEKVDAMVHEAESDDDSAVVQTATIRQPQVILSKQDYLFDEWNPDLGYNLREESDNSDNEVFTSRREENYPNELETDYAVQATADPQETADPAIESEDHSHQNQTDDTLSAEIQCADVSGAREHTINEETNLQTLSIDEDVDNHSLQSTQPCQTLDTVAESNNPPKTGRKTRKRKGRHKPTKEPVRKRTRSCQDTPEPLASEPTSQELQGQIDTPANINPTIDPIVGSGSYQETEDLPTESIPPEDVPPARRKPSSSNQKSSKQKKKPKRSLRALMNILDEASASAVKVAAELEPFPCLPLEEDATAPLQMEDHERSAAPKQRKTRRSRQPRKQKSNEDSSTAVAPEITESHEANVNPSSDLGESQEDLQQSSSQDTQLDPIGTSRETSSQISSVAHDDGCDADDDDDDDELVDPLLTPINKITELPPAYAVGEVVWAHCPEDKLFWPAVILGVDGQDSPRQVFRVTKMHLAQEPNPTMFHCRARNIRQYSTKEKAHYMEQGHNSSEFKTAVELADDFIMKAGLGKVKSFDEFFQQKKAYLDSPPESPDSIAQLSPTLLVGHSTPRDSTPPRGRQGREEDEIDDDDDDDDDEAWDEDESSGPSTSQSSGMDAATPVSKTIRKLQRKWEQKENLLIKHIMSDQSKEHLIKIQQRKIKSLRHERFFSNNPRDKSMLKDTCLGALITDEKQWELLTYLKNVLTAGGYISSPSYMMEVALPEALNFAYRKIKNISKKKADQLIMTEGQQVIHELDIT